MSIDDKVALATITAQSYKDQWSLVLKDVINQLELTRLVYVKCKHPETEIRNFEYYKQDQCGKTNRCFGSEVICKICRSKTRSIDEFNFTEAEYEFVRKAIDSVMSIPNSLVRN